MKAKSYFKGSIMCGHELQLFAQLFLKDKIKVINKFCLEWEMAMKIQSCAKKSNYKVEIMRGACRYKLFAHSFEM